MGTFVVYLFCASVIVVTQRGIAAVQRDYYKVLGLAREATDREVREVFRRLALRYHPDKDASPEAERRFLEIQQAFEVLSDPIRRGMHDLKLGLGERRRVAHGGGVLPSLGDLHVLYDAAGDSQPDFDSGDVATGFYVTVEHVTGFEPPPDRLLRPRAAVRLREHDQWREDDGAITCTTFTVDDGDNLSQVKHTRCR